MTQVDVNVADVEVVNVADVEVGETSRVRPHAITPDNSSPRATPRAPHQVVGAHKFPTHTKLGYILYLRGITVAQFSYATHINPRVLTEYLAGRQEPKSENFARMAQALSCHPTQLIEDQYPWTAELAHTAYLKGQT